MTPNDNIRRWETKFKNEIKKHLIKAMPKFSDNYFDLKLSSTLEDTKFAYDMVFNLKLNICVRIRKNKYKKFNDLTIRSKSLKNNQTELHKIMDDKERIYFYAYMTKDKNNLEEIYICDVKAIKNLYNKNYFNKESINGDGTSLIGFNFKELEKVSIENNYIFYKYPVKQLSLFNGQG